MFFPLKNCNFVSQYLAFSDRPISIHIHSKPFHVRAPWSRGLTSGPERSHRSTTRVAQSLALWRSGSCCGNPKYRDGCHQCSHPEEAWSNIGLGWAVLHISVLVKDIGDIPKISARHGESCNGQPSKINLGSLRINQGGNPPNVFLFAIFKTIPSPFTGSVQTSPTIPWKLLMFLCSYSYL